MLLVKLRYVFLHSVWFSFNHSSMSAVSRSSSRPSALFLLQSSHTAYSSTITRSVSCVVRLHWCLRSIPATLVSSSIHSLNAMSLGFGPLQLLTVISLLALQLQSGSYAAPIRRLELIASTSSMSLSSAWLSRYSHLCICPSAHPV